MTVNVLVPGGVTNTPMISDQAGFNRDKLIQPEVIVTPATPLDDNPHSIPVFGTRNPVAKAYPEN